MKNLHRKIPLLLLLAATPAMAERPFNTVR